MSDLIQIRADDLNFLRNMAYRAHRTGVDQEQFAEVMARAMSAQEDHLNALEAADISGAPAPTDRYCKAPLVCRSCDGRDIEISVTCHNSRCAGYAREIAIYQGWQPNPLTP